MRLFLYCVGLHIIGGLLLFMLTEPTPYLIFALLASAIFSSTPLLFYRVRYITNLKTEEPTYAIFSLLIAAPIILLLIDRISFGFSIELNPVLMRDQMLARQQTGASTIYAALGNIAQLGGYYVATNYLLHQRNSFFHNTLVLGFLGFIIWLAGSRAFLLVVLVSAWALGGFPPPRMKQIIILGLMLISLTAVFSLRADRSEIVFDDYLYSITNHLRISLSPLGKSIMNSEAGPFFLSAAYILHSIVVFSEIIFTSPNHGFAFASLVHLFGGVLSIENGSYDFGGLFTTSAGIFVHDIGWLGLFLVFFLKCYMLALCSRHETLSSARSLGAVLAIDSFVGIWTSVANIILALPFIAGIFCASILYDIRRKKLRLRQT